MSAGRHGLRRATRSAALLPRLQEVESDDSPFAGPARPRKEANIHWARPELVAEIEFAGCTGGGNVRQAAFKGLREDKPADEVEAETPGDAGRRRRWPSPCPKPTRASLRRQAPPDGRAAVVMGVTISNPDKALWPDDGDGRRSPSSTWRTTTRRSAPG